jgi:hypothetical protein
MQKHLNLERNAANLRHESRLSNCPLLKRNGFLTVAILTASMALSWSIPASIKTAEAASGR